MQARDLRKTLLLLVTTCCLVFGIQLLAGGCQERRACRTHKPCKITVKAAVGDAAAVFNGYACNRDTALCRTSCTNGKDEECDVCNGFGCVNNVCVLKEGVNKSECCTEDTRNKCTPFGCNTQLGECRKECSDHKHCYLCGGKACDFKGEGKCVANTSAGIDAGSVPDASNCPQPEPVEEPVADTGNPAPDAGNTDTGDPLPDPGNEDL